ncbi:hypothetical protein TELCIR_25644 [Teladorsagia circumcincta]|uniref:RRM domain-containing protein n=1 Tax=Teladorsagia circumcincta TaxID=45464 RepID=A0A2G9T4Z0_TELCI|nr:hypothetical protein TELCIR_25644 [Teladorsagia circumcincta]
MFRKIAPPIDLEVFYHPTTKKHMGMAMIVFTSFAEAHKFVLEYNGKSIMGGQVICCHDPYCEFYYIIMYYRN